MAYPQNSETEHVFTCSHLLASMRNGAANDAATAELEKLVKAVQETGKKGNVTLKFNVQKLKDGDTELQVEIKVASSIPVSDIPKGIYYGDDNGSLHRTDPRQMSLLDKRDGDRGDQDERLGRVGRGATIDGSATRHG